MLSLIIIFHIITAICYLSHNKPNNTTDTYQNETQIVFTERQKDILKDVGLSTNPDDLLDSQISAITRIEVMIEYLENKYNETFVYNGYVAHSILDREHLIAYPSKNPNIIVTVYSDYKDGQYFYEDDYNTQNE